MDYLIDWWSNKYKLPTNHELVQTRTPASLLREMMDEYAERREELLEAVEQKGADRKAIGLALQQLDQFLDIEDPRSSVYWKPDHTATEWEAAADRGEIPESLRELVPKPRPPRHNKRR